MASSQIKVFSGIRPRFPESLLPEHTATIAENCDFAYGELRNTKAGFPLSNLINEPRSIYTDTGLLFYTWPHDVDAVRSTLASDPYHRMYFTNGSNFQVTSRDGMTINGGQPDTTYKVGVPKPTVAPTFSVQLPVIDSISYTITFRFHYEYAGIKYQEQAIAPVNVGTNQARFTPPKIATRSDYPNQTLFPVKGTIGTIYKETDTGALFVWNGAAYTATTIDGTPSSATPVLRMTAILNADGSTAFDLYTNITPASGIYTLTMANDAGADSYTATLGISIKEADKAVRAYVYTYVNTYNEEGPPSPAAIVTTDSIMNVLVTITKDVMTGYAPLKEVRIYRTPTSSNIADYFYVGSITTGTSLLDNVRPSQLNEPISSKNYYAPPADLMGLTALPNGILMAGRGNELWFSEAYKPWAWPPEYVIPVLTTLMGAIAHGSGAIVTTTTAPYLVSGVSPDSMTVSKLNVNQAGVSKWSIASVDGYVVYASHDGLIVISGAYGSLSLSEQFFTRDVWRARYGQFLGTMVFSVWDGRLVVFSSAAAFVPFMIRMDEANGTMTDLPELVASCAFVSPASDQFYYANGKNLYQFNGGTSQTAVWQSREEVLPSPISFGIMQTVTEGTWDLQFQAALTPSPVPSKYGTHTAGAWTVTVGPSLITGTIRLVPGVQTIRMPDGFRSDRWRIKITGNGRFREIRMASSAVDLARL